MKKTGCLLVLVLSLHALHAQFNGAVYGVSSFNLSSHWFSRLDLTTGALTTLQQVPVTNLMSHHSSTTDHHSAFYFCDGTHIYAFDPQTGAYTTTTLTIPGSSIFMQIQFSPCDSLIYGIVKNWPSGYDFARYNTGSNSVYIIDSLPSVAMVTGYGSAFDPVHQIYYNYANGQLTGIQTSAGQVVSDVTVTELPGQSLKHITYDCTHGRIVGTSVHLTTHVTVLATVDPLTGIVSALSTTPWVNGYATPYFGGACVDQANGVYYYPAGNPDQVIGVDVQTGDTLSAQSTGVSTVRLVQHFSSCFCGPLNNEEYVTPSAAVYPNPANDLLRVRSNSQNGSYVVLTDLYGREMLRAPMMGGSAELPVSGLPAAVYVWTIYSPESIYANGYFVKE
jgi:hypothetical protein